MQIAQFGIKQYAQGLEQPAHRHDQASLSIVLCGSITETVGDSVRLLTAGDVIAKPRGLLHANSYSAPATVASLTLDGDLGDYAVARGCAVAMTVRIVDAFRNGKPIFDDLADLGALLVPAGGNVARRDGGMADVAVELEQTNRPVEEIARSVGMHRVALARAFRRAHGISLTGYRLRARAQRGEPSLPLGAVTLRDRIGIRFCGSKPLLPHLPARTGRCTGRVPPAHPGSAAVKASHGFHSFKNSVTGTAILQEMRIAILAILLSAPALIAGAATDGCAPYAPAIERALTTSGVPGVGVGIVVGDRVVCSRGFGARELARRLPVTRETEFYIASAAKPFTALAAKLVALDGKLDIDAPLDRTLPSLRLPPPLDPARMSLRDLLTHRLGFRNDGYVWRTAYSGEWTEAILFDVLAKSTLVTPRQFDYTNLGYDLAGFALTHATGQPWQSVVTESVLHPAGLRHTYTRASEIETDNIAVPYGMSGSGWVAATPKSDATMQPAGGFYTDIDDFVRWVSVNMHEGLLDGKRIYPLRAMRDVHAPQIDLDRKFGRIHRHSYALGWYHGEYDGDLLIHHFGSYPGAWAHSSYMPERKIGVAVLSNAETPLSDSIALYVYDVLIGKKDAEKRLTADAQNIHDMLAKMPERLIAMRKKIAASANDSDREPASYTGTYRNDALGTMTIRETAGNLITSMGLLKAPLDRVRGDTFLVQWLPGDKPEKVTFTTSGLTGDDDIFVKDPSP